jgi:hypothetical protein
MRNADSACVSRCPLSLRYAGPDLIPAGGTIKILLNDDLTPFVLADWFVATISADPLLGELLPDDKAKAIRESVRLRQFSAAYFGTTVDLGRAAKELGLSSSSPLRDALLTNEARTKARGLTAWLEGEPVPREVWNQAEIGAWRNCSQEVGVSP